MKIKLFPAIITLALSTLFAYGLFALGNNDEHKLLIAISGGVSLFLTLGTIVGISLDNKRASANIKTLSAVFAIAVIIANSVFSSITNASMSLFIIICCVIILLWALLVYLIATAKVKD